MLWALLLGPHPSHPPALSNPASWWFSGLCPSAHPWASYTVLPLLSPLSLFGLGFLRTEVDPRFLFLWLLLCTLLAFLHLCVQNPFVKVSLPLHSQFRGLSLKLVSFPVCVDLNLPLPLPTPLSFLPQPLACSGSITWQSITWLSHRPPSLLCNPCCFPLGLLLKPLSLIFLPLVFSPSKCLLNLKSV